MPPPPMPGMGGLPGGSPGFDPNVVYSQMLEYFQQTMQQQQQAAASMGMPAPFPGQPGFAPQMPQQAQRPGDDATVRVSVEGMKFQYQLTEDDIHKVFCRYGTVAKVIVDEACSAALVTFATQRDAQSALTDLDGKVLNGLDGTLRIKWANQQLGQQQPMNPYMSMNPGMGSLPGFPQSPAAPFGFGAPPGGGMPPMQGGMGGGSSGLGGPSERPGKGTRKYTCRFLIGIDNDKEFQVARRLIGSKGSNMKKIVQQTDAKLRLRGQGSGYFEGSGQKESSEPLQLCISCTNVEGYKTALRLTEDLLSKVHDEYRGFCRDNGLPMPDLQINLSENPIAAVSSPRGPGGYGGQGMHNMQMGGGGGSPEMMGDSPKKETRRGGRSAKKKQEGGERGQPGPNAPAPEDIMRLINDRNEARRACNFAEADRVRELLHSQGVALMDEPGARGKGQEVTTWRYWHD